MKWSFTRSSSYERVDCITPALQARQIRTDISFDLKGLLLEKFYLKVGGGQLESLCYFDHHTHFIICTVFIFIL